jgi:hypothetical protein
MVKNSQDCGVTVMTNMLKIILCLTSNIRSYLFIFYYSLPLVRATVCAQVIKDYLAKI